MLATSVTGEESLISFGEEAAMQTKLASVLTILSVALTAVVVAVFAVGPFAAIAIALISALALIAWLLIGSPADEVSDGVVAPYLLSIPLLVVLETVLYVSGWVDLLLTTCRCLPPGSRSPMSTGS